MESIVLGLSDEDAYRAASTNYGGIVGRYANRIGGGGFSIDGAFYPLPSNLNGNMHLHGGYVGFDQKEWNVISFDQHHIKLHYQSMDGEEGYPGKLNVYVNYKLMQDNSLHYSCTASTDKATPVSLSHHAYFNLSGDMNQSAKDHVLSIAADHFLQTDKNQLPTQIALVEATPFDFRIEKKIGRDIEEKNIHLSIGNGYDHCYYFGNEERGCTKVAELWDPASGRTLAIETNQPGLQLYTANWLSPEAQDYKGTTLLPYHAVCLEPQQLPDAPNRLDFPSPILRSGEIYEHQTIFRLGIR